MSHEHPTDHERRADYPLLLRLVTRIDERTENTEKSVDKLLKAMFEGNGEPPVLAQLSMLKERSRNQGRQIAALFGLLLGLFGGTTFHP